MSTPLPMFEPGKLWCDTSGVPINAHGGGMLFHKGIYYWFGEHKIEGDAGNRAMVGVHTYSSADLYNWTDEGIALPVSSASGHDIEVGCILERPKVLFNAATGKFVMWFHLEKKGCGYDTASSGVAVADRPTGPFTYLQAFRPNAGVYPLNDSPALHAAGLIGEGFTGDHPLPRLNVIQSNIFARDLTAGQMARDTNLFMDDDGIAYHIYSSEENSTLHISELAADYLSPSGRFVRVFEGRYMEAAAVFKRDGFYYLIASGCTSWDPNAARCAIAKNIMGPWHEMENPCRGVNPQNGLGPEKTFGAQSTYVQKVHGLDDAFIAMFDIWNPVNAIDGRYVWLPISWTADRAFTIPWHDAWNLTLFENKLQPRVEKFMPEKTNANRGGFTLPAQEGMDDVVMDLAKRWGADAIRDSDGTVLSDSITSLGYDVYSTLCLIRADQEWNRAHPEDNQQKYLFSTPQVARETTMQIDLLARYSPQQYRIDQINDAKKYWEVINRTTGEVVPISDWDYANGIVTVRNCAKWCVYSVNFLVFQIWETTSMYNHLTNNWGDRPHQSGVDPRKRATREHLAKFLDKWLETHPDTDFVRFTSMAYQFPIITNPAHETLYQDWYGYLDCMSAQALDEFEEKKGYRLRPNDIIDNGYLCSTDRVPSRAYLDWIEFIHEFMVDWAKQCVQQVHAVGKKAVLFYCDHWIGTEPYKPGFQQIGFDGITGPCINGREVRRVADVPGELVKELRLYPYFFAVDLLNRPTFQDGGDPVADCKRYWMWIRRAMLRKLVHRIGYGGYLDLAVKFPDFIDYIEYQTKEFYGICEHTDFTPVENAPFKVAILNAWGRDRSWGYDQSWPEGAIIESLSGQPFNLEWISFDDIRNGIPADVGVIINLGYAGTSWSGGENWKDPRVVGGIREFVDNGGGLLGVLDPTAVENGGALYQMWDVLGVQKEYGLSNDTKKVIPTEVTEGHFILADSNGTAPDLGKHVQRIYPCVGTTQIVAKDSEGSVTIATNDYGKGRGVYLAGFKLGAEQNRLLQRAIWFASGREGQMAKRWFSTNIETEIAAYPQPGKYIVINNSNEPQTTLVSDGDGRSHTVLLAANGSKWFDFDGHAI